MTDLLNMTNASNTATVYAVSIGGAHHEELKVSPADLELFVVGALIQWQAAGYAPEEWRPVRLPREHEMLMHTYELMCLVSKLWRHRARAYLPRVAEARSLLLARCYDGDLSLWIFLQSCRDGTIVHPTWALLENCFATMIYNHACRARRLYRLSKDNVGELVHQYASCEYRGSDAACRGCAEYVKQEREREQGGLRLSMEEREAFTRFPVDMQIMYELLAVQEGW